MNIEEIKCRVEKVEYTHRNGVYTCYVTLDSGWITTGESSDRTVAYHVALNGVERLERYKHHSEFWEPA